jgi:DNA modification methylase
MKRLGDFEMDRVHCGDCLELARQLPRDSVNVIATSPPYWGQRISSGVGVENDPRAYLDALVERFVELRRVLEPRGLLWINIGDAYNTPVNWRSGDHRYSSLGAEQNGLDPSNSAYTKPRQKRKAFQDKTAPWLQYGNLLALPYRLTLALCEQGYLFRGEVIWKKANPMPEGKCRRPHRAHEGIYLFTKSERHQFQVSPPIRSVWEFANEGINGVRHFSRFPTELPKRCIQAYGRANKSIVVLDPFSGAATTGLAALSLGCSYIGFEIDPALVEQSNKVLSQVTSRIEDCRSNMPSKGRLTLSPVNLEQHRLPG